jgi:hypothetical protein
MPVGNSDVPFTLRLAFPAAVAQLCVSHLRMRAQSLVIRYPGIRGQLRVATSSEPGEAGRIYIEGDAAGLRSLASLLTQLADLDQRTLPSLPDSGAAEHIHLDRAAWLTPQSAIEVVIGRLDDKHGSFDETFTPRSAPPMGDIEHRW